MVGLPLELGSCAEDDCKESDVPKGKSVCGIYTGECDPDLDGKIFVMGLDSEAAERREERDIFFLSPFSFEGVYSPLDVEGLSGGGDATAINGGSERFGQVSKGLGERVILPGEPWSFPFPFPFPFPFSLSLDLSIKLKPMPAKEGDRIIERRRGSDSASEIWIVEYGR